jgi:hypothetical protein
MVQNLERIEYRTGMLEPEDDPDDLPVKIWRKGKIPRELRKSLHEEDLLNLGGVHGDDKIGDPIEYHHVKLVLTDDVIEITVFNRAIMMFRSNDERFRRLFRAINVLEQHA